MKYIGSPGFNHGQAPLTGVLLTNLGTPDAPRRRELRAYLREFLSDPRVVEVPRLLWWFILNVIILNIRPARSARAYRSVWTEDGSPLLTHTRELTAALRAEAEQQFGPAVCVEFAMRYGSPGINAAIQDMLDRGVTRLLVLPLYPQYSGPTTASTFDAVAADFRRRRWLPELRFVSHYHDHPAYIAALAEKVRRHWQQAGQAELLLFSYHGEPRSYLDQGDPYHCHCHKTSRLLAAELGLEASQYTTVFQSRFGRAEWLRPYTDEVLRELPQRGVKFVQVVCPGFAADCLETIEEIGVENRDYFLNAGGERYEYIECLNSDRAHVVALVQLVRENLGGWLQAGSDPQQTQALYQALRQRQGESPNV